MSLRKGKNRKKKSLPRETRLCFHERHGHASRKRKTVFSISFSFRKRHGFASARGTVVISREARPYSSISDFVSSLVPLFSLFLYCFWFSSVIVCFFSWFYHFPKKIRIFFLFFVLRFFLFTFSVYSSSFLWFCFMFLVFCWFSFFFIVVHDFLLFCLFSNISLPFLHTIVISSLQSLVAAAGSAGEVRMVPFGAGRRVCPGMGVAMLHMGYMERLKWRKMDHRETDWVLKIPKEQMCL